MPSPLIELIVVVAIIGILGTMVLGGVASFTVSDGKRVGTVTKFSNKGVAWKTYEGDLLLGGSGAMSPHWNFSVTDEQVANELNKALSEQDLVEVQYHQNFAMIPWRGETTYFVTAVKVVHKPVPVPAPSSQLDQK